MFSTRIGYPSVWIEDSGEMFRDAHVRVLEEHSNTFVRVFRTCAVVYSHGSGYGDRGFRPDDRRTKRIALFICCDDDSVYRIRRRPNTPPGCVTIAEIKSDKPAMAITCGHRWRRKTITTMPLTYSRARVLS